MKRPAFLDQLHPSGKKAVASAIGVAVLSGLLVSGAILDHMARSPSVNNTGETKQQNRELPGPAGDGHNQFDPAPFENISIAAESAYVLDLTTGNVLYKKNATTSQPLASITKVMTALTATDAMPDYTVVPIRPAFLKKNGDNGLYGQERWSLDKLIDFSLITSSNDGATAIASVAGATMEGTSSYERGTDTFVEQMNAKARQLGLRATHFSNPHGLDQNERISGAYSSARDAAHLFAHAISHNYEMLEATQYPSLSFTSLSDLTHEAKNTNEVISRIPGILASKTGYTDLSGGNLAVAFDAGLNRPVVAVVLGSTYEKRFSDMLQLVNASVEKISADSTLHDTDNTTSDL